MNEIQRRKKESNYQVWLSKILSEEITNANISCPNVVDVRLSNDGSHLKVYVMFEKNEQKSIQTLSSIKGFVRSQLALYDNSRRIPEITFELDQLSKQSSRIDQLLEEIKKQGKN